MSEAQTLPQALRMQPAARDTFAINPAAQVQVITLASGCPVMMIDNFFADPLAVRQRALGGRYDSSLAYYPGLHAQIDEHERRPLLQALCALLAALGSVHCRPEDISTDFSIVTTPASEMLARQKHPHVDGVPLAGVLYLNPDYQIGTSFFRHRPTGLAFVRDEAEREAYGVWLRDHGETQQPASYAIDGTGPWEHLHATEGRFNRLVMYPGTAFHSIAMHDVARNLSMASARLTQRFFVNVNRAGSTQAH